MSEKVYPICVIGGGSAGTMAVIRSVLNNDETLFFPGTPKDKKRSRDFWVSKVENMPAHLGYKKGIVQPNKESIDWLENGDFKEKLHHKKRQGVTGIQKVGELFEVTSSEDEKYLCEYVILCTGVMDVQPKIGGSIDPILPYANIQLADYCLRCDGHHVLNKRLSVIGEGDDAAWVGIMLKERYECPQVDLLMHGKSARFSEEVQKLVNKYDFNVYESEIIEVIGDRKVLQGYKLSSGETVETDFTFISLGMIVYNELAVSLGADVDKRGFVLTDEKGETSIANFFVAGDLRANSMKQIYTAWNHAVESADKINGRIRVKKRF